MEFSCGWCYYFNEIILQYKFYGESSQNAMMLPHKITFVFSYVKTHSVVYG